MRVAFITGIGCLAVFLAGCGEPSQAEIKRQVIETLKNDPKISKDFIETLDIKYGNGTLIFYDNCPGLAKKNDEKLEKEYKKKEQARRGDVWGGILAVGFGDTVYNASLKFREECRRMRYRAANLAETIDGVKEVRVLK